MAVRKQKERGIEPERRIQGPDVIPKAMLKPFVAYSFQLGPKSNSHSLYEFISGLIINEVRALIS